MSFKSFMFPRHFFQSSVVWPAVLAGASIMGGATLLTQEKPDNAYTQFYIGGLAAAWAYHARKGHVLREENTNLRNQLIHAHMELMARDFADAFASREAPEEMGEVIEGVTRIIPDDVAPGSRLR